MVGQVWVEVFDLRRDGTARIRLWYYKWHRTRPDEPYVEFEMRLQRKRGAYRVPAGVVYEKREAGILREHLVEIAEQLRQMGMRGVTYYEYRGIGLLYFSGGFLGSVVEALGTAAVRGVEPPEVKHLGGLEYKIGEHRVEFREMGVDRGYGAKLRLSSVGEAVYLLAGLRAAGVAAKAKYTVLKFDVDSLIGLMAYTDTIPPIFIQLYASDRFRLFAEFDKNRYYLAVKPGDVWKAAWGKYAVKRVELKAREPDVAEVAWRYAVDLLRLLGAPTDVKPPRRVVNAYAFPLYGHHLLYILADVAKSVEVGSVEASLEGGLLKVRTDGIEVAVEVGAVRCARAVRINLDMLRALKLYQVLRRMGLPAEIYLGGVKLGNRALWTLLATAVGDVDPPREVAPGIALVAKHEAEGGALCAFLYECKDRHSVYFVAKAGGALWGTGGKLYKNTVTVYDKHGVVANAINSVYQKMGIPWRVACTSDGILKLAPRDLKALGIRKGVIHVLAEKLKRALV